MDVALSSWHVDTTRWTSAYSRPGSAWTGAIIHPTQPLPPRSTSDMLYRTAMAIRSPKTDSRIAARPGLEPNVRSRRNCARMQTVRYPPNPAAWRRAHERPLRRNDAARQNGSHRRITAIAAFPPKSRCPSRRRNAELTLVVTISNHHIRTHCVRNSGAPRHGDRTNSPEPLALHHAPHPCPTRGAGDGVTGKGSF